MRGAAGAAAVTTADIKTAAMLSVMAAGIDRGERTRPRVGVALNRPAIGRARRRTAHRNRYPWPVPTPDRRHSLKPILTKRRADYGTGQGGARGVGRREHRWLERPNP